MDIIKKTALQGFSISVLLLAITACGGSSDDDKKSVTPASLTTTTDIAKAVAGIQAAKTIFDVVISNNQAGIEESITNGDVNKDVSCGTSPSAGKFKITPNTSTVYAKDGTGVSSMCLEDGEKFDGTLVYQCNDASCDSALSTATNLLWGDTNKAIDLKVNGTSTRSVASMPQDEFRGTASIIKSGASTTFSSYDRLVTQYFAKNRIVGYGGLTVSGGSSTSCIDGTYAYSVKESLAMNSGTQRITGGLIRISSGGNSEGPEAGTVLFNADGSVKVKLANGIETTVSKTEFESYCGLKEAYDFSEKL